MPEALFVRDGARFVPTQAAGSPWSADALHGGAVAALLAHALEGHAPDREMPVARLTVDLMRPAPRSHLEISTRVTREGKRIQIVEGSLRADGVEVARASALRVRTDEAALPEIPSTTGAPRGPEGLPTERLVDPARLPRGIRIPPGLHSTVEIRRVDGLDGQGFGIAWIRVPLPIVAGTVTTPLMRAAATADLANGVAQVQGPTGFINADLSLHLHRIPEGEWLCLEARSRVHPSGIGLVECLLYDTRGPAGRVTQTLLARARHSATS